MPLPGGALLRVVVEIRYAFAQSVAERNLRKVVFGHFALGFHPCEGVRGCIVFQGTVWVFHRHSEIGVGGGVGRRIGICDPFVGRGA